MADDPLRALFDSTTTDAGPLDPQTVIARSRRRRLPARVAVGGAATLAVAGLFVGVVAGLHGLSTSSASSSVGSVAASQAAPKTPPAGRATGTAKGTPTGTATSGAAGGAIGGIALAPADKLNACTGALAPTTPSSTGLVITPHFRDVSRDATSDPTTVDGTVTLTNTSGRAWKGTTTSRPSITLSRHGIVVWHSNGFVPMAPTLVDIPAGASVSLPATLDLAVCGLEDDKAPQFPRDLPRAPAGEYAVSAAIDFTEADGSVDLITGSQQTITVR